MTTTPDNAALRALGRAQAAAYVESELDSFQRAIQALAVGYGSTALGATHIGDAARAALRADIEEQAR